MRTYLTVTAATFEAALGCDADAWIVDLGRADASALIARLREHAPTHRPPLHLRVGCLTDAQLADALAVPGLPQPAAILVSVEHGCDIARAGAVLAVHEAEQGWPDGATQIIALVARAAGALNLASLAGASPRLAGIGWDADALASELGANTVADGWSAPLAYARAMVRIAAAAAGVEAIETACPYGSRPGAHAQNALQDGFGTVFARTRDEAVTIRSTISRIG